MKNDKVSIVFILSFLLIFLSILTIYADPPNKKVVYEFKGTFSSELKTVGTIDWKLYSDGSLEGSWITNNGTFNGNIKGFYLIRKNEIVLSAYGQSILQSQVQSNIIIFASGNIKQKEASGKFVVYLENPNYPDDKGTWKVTINTL